MQDDRLPILPLHPDEHGRRPSVSRDDDTVLLSIVHALAYFLLEIADGNGLHRISPVVFPGGFIRIARTYTTPSASGGVAKYYKCDKCATSPSARLTMGA